MSDERQETPMPWESTGMKNAELLEVLQGFVAVKDLMPCFCAQGFNCSCCSAVSAAKKLIDKLEVPA